MIGIALNKMQDAFCVLYTKSGNAAEAYRLAGYKCKTPAAAAAGASRLLKKVNIRERIKELNKAAEDAKIADIREVKQFWTAVMRDAREETKDRMKASENLARTAVENHNENESDGFIEALRETAGEVWGH